MVKTNQNSLWAAVRVQGGFATEVQLFFDKQIASKQMDKWKKDMNPDYDDVNVFTVKMPQNR